MKKSEHSLRNLSNTSKYTNICIVGIPEGKEKGKEKIFEKIMAENFPNFMKYMIINIQEAQQTPSKVNSKKPTPNSQKPKTKSKY